MILHRPPLLINWYYGNNLLLQKPSKKPVLYLTFDDGPTENVSCVILDILKARNAQATFFCCGKNAKKHPELMQRILNEGHCIGNHTFSHLNGKKTDSFTYFEDIEKCDNIVKSHLFRPPYGRISRSQVKELSKKYQIVLWSLLTEDYNIDLSPETCLKNAIKRTKNGDIVLFHDSRKAEKNVVYALPRYLDFFIEKGYTFQKL